ncbi:hypothetical protein [Dyadobacter tibetensis]|uniref:hypothetical protein n=1 Tax=Dyadobacter tibetensis TaxID=1211851 RepID=UPI000472A0EB|nr:hypothetical protein [Dyadobacter tibetensis]
MFTFLYETLIGPNNNPEYRDVIFPFVGLFTLLFAIATALVFYIILGRKWLIWYTTTHWTITLIGLLILGFSFALTNAENAIGMSDSYNTRLGLANMLYIFIYFILFSFIFKRFSIFAKRTPF